MELEELKKPWKQNDELLEQHLSVDEEQLKKVCFNKINRWFLNFRRVEFVNILVCIGLIVLYSYYAQKYISDFRYFGTSLLTILFVLLNLILSTIEFVGYKKIISFNDEILKKQKEIIAQKKRVGAFFQIEIASLPFIFAFGLPAYYRSLYPGVDLLRHHYSYYLFIVIFCSVIAFALSFWLYRKYYVNYFKKAEKELSSIYENEE